MRGCLAAVLILLMRKFVPKTACDPTRASAKARTRGNGLCSPIEFANPQDVVNALFEEFEALARRQRQHPADQRKVDAIFAV